MLDPGPQLLEQPQQPDFAGFIITCHPHGRDLLAVRYRLGKAWRTRLALVTIKALPALAPQVPARQHLVQQRMGPVARFLIKLAIYRFHHRQADIQANQVEQFERPHREPGADPQHRINQARRRHPSLRIRSASVPNARPAWLTIKPGESLQIAGQWPTWRTSACN